MVRILKHKDRFDAPELESFSDSVSSPYHMFWMLAAFEKIKPSPFSIFLRIALTSFSRQISEFLIKNPELIGTKKIESRFFLLTISISGFATDICIDGIFLTISCLNSRAMDEPAKKLFTAENSRFPSNLTVFL